MTTQTDAQICALKELLMAKQAYHRSLNEFLNTLPEKVRDDRVVYMVQHLPNIDPREIGEETVTYVKGLAYGVADELGPNADDRIVSDFPTKTAGKRPAKPRKLDAAMMAEIYKFVVEECRNGCTNARDARIFIMKKCPEWVDQDGPETGYYLGQYLDTLNFSAIRENSKDLVNL